MSKEKFERTKPHVNVVLSATLTMVNNADRCNHYRTG
ncbi:Uncharacterised protein [Escherichia coli]|uniref:Uncharacterized protein n=1 Tax=Escherichia coli TaxID=562 RepID=A0A485JLM8_ECOLX|nr:Uncharacterised protein [Escherichia coli]